MADNQYPKELPSTSELANRIFLDKMIGDEKQAEGIVPTTSPIDLVAGAAGARLGSAMAADAGSILGNEIGAVGSDIRAAQGRLPAGWRAAADTENKSILHFQHPEHGTVTVAPGESGAFEIRHGGSLAGLKGQKGVFEEAPDALSHAMDYIKAINEHEVLPKASNVLPKGTAEYADGGEVEAPSTPDFISDDQMSSLAPQIHTQPQPNIAPSSAPDFIPEDQFVSDEDKYGTAPEMAKTALEGAARGVLGPLAPAAERAFGVNPEDIRRRAEVNPITSTLGEIGGLGASLATGVGEGAIAAKLGAKAAEALPFIAEGGGLAARLGSAAAKGAVENAVIGASDDVSRMIMQDPNASVGHAVSDLGLNAVLGGAIGGGAGAIGELWNAKFGGKLAQELENFKGRMDEHINNPDPVNAVTEELTNHYNAVKDMADEVYGPKGLKAEAIAKAMPPMGKPILDQSESILGTLESSMERLAKDDHLPLLEEEVGKYKSALESNDPAQIFNATQEMKQQLQEWGKYNSSIAPLKERTFRNVAKDLAFDLRSALEDSKVWGDAATIQKDINSAFSKFVNPLKQFESKFTSKITDMSTGKIANAIDPAKITSYMNQLGKPNAELKKEMLSNFLDASGKYKDAITRTYAKIGVESPVPASSLARTLSTLEEITPGAKLADIFMQKGLSEGGGKAIGAGIGGALGHAVEMPGLGALLGAHALGPFFSSVLPAIVKPILGSEASGLGMKAASQYATAVSKGVKLSSSAIKNLFKGSSEVLPQYAIPSVADREKLDKTLKKLGENPNSMLASQDNKVGNYLPDHSASMSQTAMSAVNYLNSLRAPSGKLAPLDSTPVMNSVQKGAFDRALNIAQQPLIVLDHIKKGSLIPSDLAVMKNLYPNLYKDLQAKMLSQIAEVKSKGHEIPYKMRISLSQFLQQPMDSTLSPQYILSAQPSPITAPQQPAPGSAGKVKRGTASLSKLSEMYQTPGQNAAKDKSTRH